VGGLIWQSVYIALAFAVGFVAGELSAWRRSARAFARDLKVLGEGDDQYGDGCAQARDPRATIPHERDPRAIIPQERMEKRK
jgi:hypothetical protein